MLEVFDFARKVARHYTNVLVVGQTGTGKELVARAIHQLSPVSTQRLAVCNCSALVDTLLESQLFGHVRGSFTGATDTRPGLFEYANGGTVFLDEIGETSLAMQAKLLRVIQNREIQRVGSPEVKQINVRLIAATNRDLRAEVLAGRFREDLFYRLNSIQIRIPPLSERSEDVPLLVQYFLKEIQRGLRQENSRAFAPGAVSTAATPLAGECPRTRKRHFERLHHGHRRLYRYRRPPRTPAAPSRATGARGDDWRPLSLEEVRKIHIQRVLDMCQGNRLRAAHILGIGRTSLYRYLKRDGASERKGARAGTQSHSTLFRTGTVFSWRYKNGLSVANQKPKTQDLPDPDFGTRPAIGIGTENDAESQG